jgi:hypothetical protein
VERRFIFLLLGEYAELAEDFALEREERFWRRGYSVEYARVFSLGPESDWAAGMRGGSCGREYKYKG